MYRSLHPALAFFTLLALIPRPAHSQSTITVDGSARVVPITQEVARMYQELMKGTVKIAVKSSSTASGLKSLCRGEIDISGATRPMVREELDLCKHSGVEYYEIPIAYDVLAIIVNGQNHWANSITLEDLKRLWARSGPNPISQWKQLQSQWPGYSIRLFGSPPDSESFEFFSAALYRNPKALRGDVNSRGSSGEITDAVSRNPLAIGYCPIADCAKKTTAIKLLPIDLGQGPIAPSAQNVQSNRYGRLSRPLFLYINRKSTEQVDIHRLVALYLLRASQVVSLAGYVPLEESVYRVGVKVMKNKKVGSVYDGVAPADQAIEQFVRANASLR